jgi:hypothetical protein
MPEPEATAFPGRARPCGFQMQKNRRLRALFREPPFGGVMKWPREAGATRLEESRGERDDDGRPGLTVGPWLCVLTEEGERIGRRFAEVELRSTPRSPDRGDPARMCRRVWKQQV